MPVKKYIHILLIFTLCFHLCAVLYAQEQEKDLLTRYIWNDVVTMPAGKRPKIAVVLGGGGARGLSHIGVLKVLEEEGIPIDLIVGTSVGALIGALYCSGLPIDEIRRMGEEIGWDKLTNVSSAALVKLLVTESLLSNEKLEEYLNAHLGDKKFSDLVIPFVSIATDIQTGERIIFRDGPVIQAIRASSTIPGVFKPVEYRHRFLVDGGLVGNIPTDIAQMMGADLIIAVSVKADFTDYRTANVLQILNQSIYIQGQHMAEDLLKNADFVISPQVGDMSAIELWRSKQSIEAGILSARQSMPDLKQLIMDRTFEQILEISEK
ncbi:MAG: patatin-like phospholipase family protein [bacterium]